VKSCFKNVVISAFRRNFLNKTSSLNFNLRSLGDKGWNRSFDQFCSTKCNLMALFSAKLVILIPINFKIIKPRYLKNLKPSFQETSKPDTLKTCNLVSEKPQNLDFLKFYNPEIFNLKNLTL
jgi:hypothetical protein